MSMYEGLKTCFNVIIAFFTQDILVSFGIAFLAIIIVWSIFSLAFNYEMNFRTSCDRVTAFLKRKSLTRDNYGDFTALFGKFPSIMRRSWKSYELCAKGKPSEYLKQSECLDLQLSGGIQRQGRSLMKTFINTFFIFMCLISFAVISSSESTITTRILTDALLVPLLFFALMKIVYYVYTTVRHNEYKTAVESFNDMVDILDERVNLPKIFKGYEIAIPLISNVYSNQTFSKIRNEEIEQTFKQVSQEIKDAEKLDEDIRREKVSNHLVEFNIGNNLASSQEQLEEMRRDALNEIEDPDSAIRAVRAIHIAKGHTLGKSFDEMLVELADDSQVDTDKILEENKVDFNKNIESSVEKIEYEPIIRKRGRPFKSEEIIEDDKTDTRHPFVNFDKIYNGEDVAPYTDSMNSQKDVNEIDVVRDEEEKDSQDFIQSIIRDFNTFKTNNLDLEVAVEEDEEDEEDDEDIAQFEDQDNKVIDFNAENIVIENTKQFVSAVEYIEQIMDINKSVEASPDVVAQNNKKIDKVVRAILEYKNKKEGIA